MMMRSDDPQSGVTLTELMVVIVLASVVMTGLVVFYLNAQSLWMDSSAQAITQRELSLALRTISQRARTSNRARVDGDPRVDLQLRLDKAGPTDPDSTFCFFLNHADSTLHSGYVDAHDVSRQDLGPIIQSRITLMAVHTDAYMVYVDSLQALTPQNAPLTMGSSVALMNR
jgi:prepilin-type N-terminal cleavage/methylation domain-containing protein